METQSWNWLKMLGRMKIAVCFHTSTGGFRLLCLRLPSSANGIIHVRVVHRWREVPLKRTHSNFILWFHCGQAVSTRNFITTGITVCTPAPPSHKHNAVTQQQWNMRTSWGNGTYHTQCLHRSHQGSPSVHCTFYHWPGRWWHCQTCIQNSSLHCLL